jgi:hypothetical protein
MQDRSPSDRPSPGAECPYLVRTELETGSNEDHLKRSRIDDKTVTDMA